MPSRPCLYPFFVAALHLPFGYAASHGFIVSEAAAIATLVAVSAIGRRLGFLSPKDVGSVVSTRDVQGMIHLIKMASRQHGLSSADSDLLEQLLLARAGEATAVASANFSGSSCDGGDGGI